MILIDRTTGDDIGHYTNKDAARNRAYVANHRKEQS